MAPACPFELPEPENRPDEEGLAIEPEVARMLPGQEQRFTLRFARDASARDVDNVDVTWTSEGGRLAPDGDAATYVAGAVPGEHTISATLETGGRSV